MNRVNMLVNQFDIVIEAYTRHNVLVDLDKIENHRHQDIHLLFNRYSIKLC